MIYNPFWSTFHINFYLSLPPWIYYYQHWASILAWRNALENPSRLPSTPTPFIGLSSIASPIPLYQVASTETALVFTHDSINPVEIKGGKDGCDKALLATKGKQVDGELPAAEDQTKSCERPSHAHLLRVSAGPEQSPLSSLSNPRVPGVHKVRMDRVQLCSAQGLWIMERDQRVNDYKKVFVESPRFYISFFLSIYFSQDDRLSVKRKKGRGSKSWEYSYCA